MERQSYLWRARPEPVAEQNPPTGIAVAVGSAVIVVSAVVSAAVPPYAGTVRLGLVAVALAGFAGLTINPAAVAAVSVLGFLVFDGFLVNQLGELSWHGPADVRRLMVLAAAGVLGLGAGTAYRAVRRIHTWRRRSEWIAAQVRDAAQPRDGSPSFDGVIEWKRRRYTVLDVVFVLLTVALFAGLALAVRAVEKL